MSRNAPNKSLSIIYLKRRIMQPQKGRQYFNVFHKITGFPCQGLEYDELSDWKKSYLVYRIRCICSTNIFGKILFFFWRISQQDAKRASQPHRNPIADSVSQLSSRPDACRAVQTPRRPVGLLFPDLSICLYSLLRDFTRGNGPRIT